MIVRLIGEEQHNMQLFSVYSPNREEAPQNIFKSAHNTYWGVPRSGPTDWTLDGRGRVIPTVPHPPQ